jgi:membrane protein implicated in regulation of membrane protease activity
MMMYLYVLALMGGAGLLLLSWGRSVREEADDDGETGFWGVLSTPVLVYFLAGFGATGGLLEQFTTTPELNALLWALLIGVLASGAAAAVYGWLQSSGPDLLTPDANGLVGLSARVLISVGPGKRGRVQLASAGHVLELPARLYGGGDRECRRGDAVIIVQVEGEVVLVAPARRERAGAG